MFYRRKRRKFNRRSCGCLHLQKRWDEFLVESSNEVTMWKSSSIYTLRSGKTFSFDLLSFISFTFVRNASEHWVERVLPGHFLWIMFAMKRQRDRGDLVFDCNDKYAKNQTYLSSIRFIFFSQWKRKTMFMFLKNIQRFIGRCSNHHRCFSFLCLFVLIAIWNDRWWWWWWWSILFFLVVLISTDWCVRVSSSVVHLLFIDWMSRHTCPMMMNAQLHSSWR